MDLRKILKGGTKKSDAKETTQPDDMPVYKGQREFKICEGEGCSKIATKEAANLYGVDYNQMSPQDAWYKKAAVLKAGGSVVWNKASKEMKGLKVGDFVSLDRGISGKELYKSNAPGYSMKQNEGNEHLGVVVGKDENGRVLVKHGSESGKVYVQPIDELHLPEYGFNYTPTSIYRSKATEGKQIVNKKNYESQDKYQGVDRTRFSPNYIPTENESKFVNALNAHAQEQQNILGLTAKEGKLLRDISFGVFQNESRGGASNEVFPKMIASQLAHAFGRKASPSLGDVQFKYDDLRQNADKTLTAIGRRMDELNVQKTGMSSFSHDKNYNDETNAVMALLSSNYNKIKSNPKKYQYDPVNNTVYGDVPLDQALLSSYNKPGFIDSKKKLLSKEAYGKNALSKMGKLDEEYAKKGTKKLIPTVKEMLKKAAEQSNNKFTNSISARNM
jgi:hypothetical protein